MQGGRWGSMTLQGHMNPNLIQNQCLGIEAHKVVFRQFQRSFVCNFCQILHVDLQWDHPSPQSLPLHSAGYQHFVSSLSVKSQINQPPPLISRRGPFHSVLCPPQSHSGLSPLFFSFKRCLLSLASVMLLWLLSLSLSLSICLSPLAYSFSYLDFFL